MTENVHILQREHVYTANHWFKINASDKGCWDDKGHKKKINNREVNWLSESALTITTQIYSNQNFNKNQRSTSKLSRADLQSKNNRKETFASILSSNTSGPFSIKIIQIMGDVHSTKEEVIQKLYADNIGASIRILSIKRSGKFTITCQCVNAEEAEKLETMLKRKYRNALAFKSANVIKPMIKIVRLFTQLSENEILNQWIEQNAWLIDRQIEIIL